MSMCFLSILHCSFTNVERSEKAATEDAIKYENEAKQSEIDQTTKMIGGMINALDPWFSRHRRERSGEQRKSNPPHVRASPSEKMKSTDRMHNKSRQNRKLPEKCCPLTKPFDSLFKTLIHVYKYGIQETDVETFASDYL